MPKPRGHEDRGAVAIVVAVFVILAMVLLALVVDRGQLYVARAQLQNAADAAALAGAQSLCTSEDARQTAFEYAELNGIDALDDNDLPTGNFIVDPVTEVGNYEYLHVIGTATVGFAFGPFAGIAEGSVAAQATARRLCRLDFRFVSDRITNFNGGSSSADNIYAGECFEGSGGSYGIVAVWVADSYTECWPPPRKPIDLGTTGDGNPGTGTAVYNTPPGGVPTITATSAAKQVWPSIDTLNTYTPTVSCRSVSEFTTANHPDGETLTCVAQAGGNLVLQSAHTVRHVVADDDISDKDADPMWVLGEWDDETDEYLVYSRTGNITISGNYLPKNVTLYAPNGTASFSGSGATIDGRVFAKNIVLNGGGADAATGVGVPIRGNSELVD